MLRTITGYALLAFCIASALAFAAMAGYATGYQGCALTCQESREFLNSPAFVYWLGNAFAALIGATALLISTTRRR